MTNVTLHQGDVLPTLRRLRSESVQCVVTSPPYWGLRDYGLPQTIWGGDSRHSHEWGSTIPVVTTSGFHRRKQQTTSGGIKDFSSRANSHGAFCACGAWLGCLGLEPTPELYVEHIVAVFREARRVLRNDGTLWLNLGDSYSARSTHAAGNKNDSKAGIHGHQGECARAMRGKMRHFEDGLKPKDLVGMPWRVAFALQADGWYLRSDIIWHKPNPMPESVTDRPTKAHEYLFLLTKSQRYYYDAAAVKEPCVEGEGFHGGYNHPGCLGAPRRNGRKALAGPTYSRHRSSIPGGQSLQAHPNGKRNRRSVWSVSTRPFKGAHFATFPPKLIEPCILAGSRPGDVVMDLFNGAGTTGLVALEHGRKYRGIELNPDYCDMTIARLGSQPKQQAVELHA